MRWILMAMVLGGCIEEAERKPHDYVPPVSCGKCVLVFQQVWIPDEDGFNQRCVEFFETGEICCASRGDVDCPLDSNGYELRECDDPEGASCNDSDAKNDYCVSACP